MTRPTAQGATQAATWAATRAATWADLPGILSLYQAFNSYDPTYTAELAEPAWTALQSSGLVTVFIADSDGLVAATCTLAVVPNLTWSGRPYAVIENVVTHPDHRRKGLGQAVLTAACGHAWAAGCYKITLSTGSSDEATLRFYESAGFTRNAKTFFEMRRQ